MAPTEDPESPSSNEHRDSKAERDLDHFTSGLLEEDMESKKLREESDMDSTDLDPETRCGFWVFQAPWLQPCARIESFTGLYSVAALITSTLNVYVNSQITTLERQFGFSSTQTGLIMAANDVGFLVCVLFLSYSASKFHIPRSLGIACFIFGFSGLACSLPFFLFRSSIDAMVATFSGAGGGDNVTSQATSLAKPSGMFGDLCLPNKTAVLTPETAGGERLALSFVLMLAYKYFSSSSSFLRGFLKTILYW
ncbi:solute carrier organic anion transporter family member [Elysia marginata]|uniref:Solute carrier organic anion transporter family member n=1 Tax=Elysia marginata TaxID=1093978 RepID=A0AAV4J705_9GAST|nr:solute carrier organic anion transporter family member [Elysia marginata]